nr:calcium-activated chloride channel regulator 4A-like [Cherax quadricarinatus]
MTDYENVASRLQFLKDSVSQFIRFKAVPQTRVGLVIFADDVLISKELQLLNTDDNRNSLIQTILLNFSNKQKKNLLPGILQAVKILGNEKGVIVLVTENLEAYQPSPSLIDAAQGYQVWPILYPHDDNIPIQVYQDLADIVPGTPVLTASNIIDTVMILGNLNSYQSVDSYAALSENLLKVGGNSLEKVADGTCSEKVCSVTLAVNDGIQYESNAFIEVLYSMVEVMLVPSPSINISASSYSENLIKFELPILTSKMFAVEHPQNTSYTVDIQRKTDVTLVKAMLLATPVNVFNILVWSSQGLTNLYYTTSSVPTLFAMVMKGWHHVLYADVTAIITSKTGEMILKLHDDGVGGDVTGNDGVYSAYMVQFYPPDNVTIMVTATDNNGTARILASATDNGTAHALVSAFHSSPGTEEQACCGSQLIIPDELLENPGSFSVSSPSIIGYLTGDPPDSLLPAQITDLRSLRDNQNVTLMFTAPGDQLDLGTDQDINLSKSSWSSLLSSSE